MPKNFNKKYFTLLVIFISIHSYAIAQWNTDPMVNNAVAVSAGTTKYTPKIIKDDVGGYIITWHDANTVTGEADVYAQKITADGKPLWSTGGVPVCNIIRDQKWHDAVSDGSGGAIVTWIDSRPPGNMIVYFQRIDANGIPQWNGNQGISILNFNAGTLAQSPYIISDNKGGAIITWWEGRGGGTLCGYVQRIDHNGIMQWTTNGVKFASSTSWSQSISPTLVSDGNNGAIVTWHTSVTSSSDVYVQRIDSSGILKWGASGLAVSTAPNIQYAPQIMSNGEKGAIVNWVDLRNNLNYSIYAQYIDSAGTNKWQSNGVQINFTGGLPSSTTDAHGGVIFTWTDDRRNFNNNDDIDTTDIYAQRIDKNGIVRWNPTGVVICNATNLQRFPSISYDNDGWAIIAWEQYKKDFDDVDIYAQRIDTNGNVQCPLNGIPVANNSTFQFHPQLSGTYQKGDAIAVWEDTRNAPAGSNSKGDVYASRIIWPLPLVPSISIKASENNICSGKTVTFSATATNGGANPLYQWKKNGMDIGINSSTYSDGQLNDKDSIFCILTNTDACIINNTATSDTIGIKVNGTGFITNFSIAVQATSICKGNNATFSISIDNEGINPLYQWKINGVSTANTGKSFTTNQLKHNDIVSCELTTTNCNSLVIVNSNAIQMNVYSIVHPQIIIETPEVNVCEGIPVNFTALASNGNEPDLQWYSWKINGVEIINSHFASFSTTSLKDGDLVNCILTDKSVCTIPETALSNDIIIGIKPTASPEINISSSSTKICKGDKVTFSAQVLNEGADAVYQWKINGINNENNTATFVTTDLKEADIISCSITTSNTCASTTTVVSNPITIIVNPINDLHINITASDNLICEGDRVDFEATVQNSITDLTYQWKWNETSVGNNSNTYSNNKLETNDKVYCIVSSPLSNCTNNFTASNIITVSVNDAPSIRIQPNDTIIAAGSSIQLNSIVKGNISSFEWTNTNDLANPSSISPFTKTLTNNALFTLTVTGMGGCTAQALSNIKVITTLPLAIPSAFTPNGDGNNDVFRIPPYVSLLLKELSIYDRWGNLIFTTANITKGWDGTLNGAKAAIGTYIYVIKGMDENGLVFLKGNFILIR